MNPSPHRAGRVGLAFSAGLLFSAGLVLSGMTQPLKVLGFLDITAIGKGPFPGLWDPTLAFVMGGAVCVTFFHLLGRGEFLKHPCLTINSMSLPGAKSICHCLAVLFYLARDGVWWAIAPGQPWPALF